MEVLMINTVPRVGRKGEIKKVAEGFARNYLFPRNYAILATEGARNHLNLMKNSWEKQAAREKQAFVDMAGKIEGLVLKLTRKAGKPYGKAEKTAAGHFNTGKKEGEN